MIWSRLNQYLPVEDTMCLSAVHVAPRGSILHVSALWYLQGVFHHLTLFTRSSPFRAT